MTSYILQENTINKTQSLCPICQKPIEAFYVEEKAKVYFVKECPEHGLFKTIAAENAQDYRQWIKNPVINIPPKGAMTVGDPNDKSCPLHCGTCENHLQTACCVLIDITDRCNQHCPYCFARSEMDADRSGEPTLQEIEAKYDLLLDLGEERPFNIQLSGGEPTVRDDLPEIIAAARQRGFEYIQINTNGRRLALEDGYAQMLKEAGATVMFMQFDGTRDDIYEALRGEPLFEIKQKAIRNCEKAGLAVTLVPTVVEGVNTDNIGEMMDFLVENVNVVKGIHFQPVSFFGRHPEQVETCAKGAGPGDAKGTGAMCAKDCASATAKGAGAALNGIAEISGERGSYGSGDFPGRITMFELLRKLEEQRPAFKYEDFCPIATGHTLCCFYSTYTREPDGSIKCMLTAKQRDEGVSCCDTAGEYADACCCDEASDGTVACCEEAMGGGASDCCGQSIDKGISCCDALSVDALEVIKKDRDYVLNKWEIAEPEESCCCGGETSAEGPCCCEPGEGQVADDECCCCGTDDDTSCCQPEQDAVMDIDEFLRYYRQNTFTVTGMAFQDIMNLDAERVKRCRVQVLSEDDKLIPFCAYNTIYRREVTKLRVGAEQH